MGLLKRFYDGTKTIYTSLLILILGMEQPFPTINDLPKWLGANKKAFLKEKGRNTRILVLLSSFLFFISSYFYYCFL